MKPRPWTTLYHLGTKYCTVVLERAVVAAVVIVIVVVVVAAAAAAAVAAVVPFVETFFHFGIKHDKDFFKKPKCLHLFFFFTKPIKISHPSELVPHLCPDHPGPDVPLEVQEVLASVLLVHGLAVLEVHHAVDAQAVGDLVAGLAAGLEHHGVAP